MDFRPRYRLYHIENKSNTPVVLRILFQIVKYFFFKFFFYHDLLVKTQYSKRQERSGPDMRRVFSIFFFFYCRSIIIFFSVDLDSDYGEEPANRFTVGMRFFSLGKHFFSQ